MKGPFLENSLEIEKNIKKLHSEIFLIEDDNLTYAHMYECHLNYSKIIPIYQGY